MNLEDFVKCLPKIARENQEEMNEGEGEFLIDDKIVYPDDLDYGQIDFENEGKRITFGLAFQNVSSDKFSEFLLDEVLKLVKKNNQFRELKLGMYWDADSFLNEEYDLTDLDSVHIGAYARKSGECFPGYISANFPPFGSLMKRGMGLTSSGIYTKYERDLVKKFKLKESKEEFCHGHVKKYGKDLKQIIFDMKEFVREVRHISPRGYDNDVIIEGVKKTNTLEFKHIILPSKAKVYEVEIISPAMPVTKTRGIRKTPIEISYVHETPANSISINTPRFENEKGDFNFWLDVNSPELIELQSYVCQAMGISFR